MPVRSPVDYLDTDPESYIGDDDADVAAQEQLAQQRRAAQMPAASVPIAPMPPQAGPDTSALQAAIQRRTQLEQNAPIPPKPKWWQRLAAAGAGAAIGASNVRGHAGYIDPTAPEQAILAPGYGRQQMEYQRQLQGAKAAEQGELEKLSIPAQIEKEVATTAELKGRGKFYEQQAKTLADEGKRAPKGNYIAVKDAIFDATTGQWLNGKAPSATSPDVMEINPEKGKALGIQPTSDGRYLIPKEGIGPYLTSQRPQTPTAEADKQKIDAILQKAIDEGTITRSALTDPNKTWDGVVAAKTVSPAEKNAVRSYLLTHSSPASTIQGGVLRIEALGQTRGVSMLDTKNGNAPVEVPWSEIARANKEEPGRYIPSAGGTQALTRTALLEDMRGSLNQVRTSLATVPEFTPADKAKIAVAMRDRNPRSAIEQLIGSAAGSSLTPDQQEYLINLAQLHEQALALRTTLGAGQGSEDLRAAIFRTIPGPSTPNKAYAVKQLDAFEKTLNRLSRGVPKVPLRTDLGNNPPSPNQQTNVLPPEAVQKLKEGIITTFGNGQRWTLQNGKPVQAQ